MQFLLYDRSDHFNIDPFDGLMDRDGDRALSLFPESTVTASTPGSAHCIPEALQDPAEFVKSKILIQ